jgi:phosphoribosylamine--glycine ligase
MNVLVIGAGAREHALAWKLAQGQGVERVFVAPGNAGTAAEPRTHNVPLAEHDHAGLVAFAREQAVDLTVVGPEAPLVAGLRDRFDAAGLACIGPHAAAAQLEGSKAFAKAFLDRHRIPTARHATFTDPAAAVAWIRAAGAPIVVKADGLAAGKGVVVAHDVDTAVAAATSMLADGSFGDAGRRIVVEEFLDGEEVSFIVLSDGRSVLPLATSQDHKRIFDGDRGPNTGGMGAYSPAPVVTPALHARIMREIIDPTLAGMRADGVPYEGFLYAGLMVGRDGVARVIEFNCRLGDPEAAPLLMRLDGDLVLLLRQAARRELAGAGIGWRPQAAIAVVMAAAGYPQQPRRGDVIGGDVMDGAGDAPGAAVGEPLTKVFHAGTARDGRGTLVTAGGRVLCVGALGDSLAAAHAAAYVRVRGIRFRGAQYRSDIGHRALSRADSP